MNPNVPNKVPSHKKSKNLSPAKKFKLRLRRAKFQKQQQAKDDYFEHDNRDAAKALSATAASKKKKGGRLNRKNRRAKMYIDAYLKSRQNADTASQEDSSTGNDLAMKSMVQRALLSTEVTSVGGKEQPKRLPSTASKCCCHCACTGTKRKPRRKLSSPYFGDFNRLNLPNGSACAGQAAAVTTKVFNKTTSTRETLVKADTVNFINYNKIPLKSAKIEQQIFERSFFAKDRVGVSVGGAAEMRNVTRFGSYYSSFGEVSGKWKGFAVKSYENEEKVRQLNPPKPVRV